MMVAFIDQSEPAELLFPAPSDATERMASRASGIRIERLFMGPPQQDWGSWGNCRGRNIYTTRTPNSTAGSMREEAPEVPDPNPFRQLLYGALGAVNGDRQGLDVGGPAWRVGACRGGTSGPN